MSRRPSHDDLAEAVLDAARRRGWRVATAESCTAGMIAALLARAPGAADTLDGGVVSYTKAMKQALLGVSAELLATKTAVCAEVAEAMARGVLAHAPSDVAVAITGVGGPEPDEDGNPVGLFYVAVADRSGTACSRRIASKAEGREAILHEGIEAALHLLRDACESKSAKAPSA